MFKRFFILIFFYSILIRNYQSVTSLVNISNCLSDYSYFKDKKYSKIQIEGFITNLENKDNS